MRTVVLGMDLCRRRRPASQRRRQRPPEMVGSRLQSIRCALPDASMLPLRIKVRRHSPPPSGRCRSDRIFSAQGCGLQSNPWRRTACADGPSQREFAALDEVRRLVDMPKCPAGHTSGPKHRACNAGIGKAGGCASAASPLNSVSSGRSPCRTDTERGLAGQRRLRNGRHRPWADPRFPDV